MGTKLRGLDNLGELTALTKEQVKVAKDLDLTSQRRLSAYGIKLSGWPGYGNGIEGKLCPYLKEKAKLLESHGLERNIHWAFEDRTNVSSHGDYTTIVFLLPHRK